MSRTKATAHLFERRDAIRANNAAMIHGAVVRCPSFFVNDTLGKLARCVHSRHHDGSHQGVFEGLGLVWNG